MQRGGAGGASQHHARLPAQPSARCCATRARRAECAALLHTWPPCRMCTAQSSCAVDPHALVAPTTRYGTHHARLPQPMCCQRPCHAHADQPRGPVPQWRAHAWRMAPHMHDPCTCMTIAWPMPMTPCTPAMRLPAVLFGGSPQEEPLPAQPAVRLPVSSRAWQAVDAGAMQRQDREHLQAPDQVGVGH